MNSAASLIRNLDDERLYDLVFRAAEEVFDHDEVIYEQLVPPVPIRVVLFTYSLDGYIRCAGLKGYVFEALPNHFIPSAFDIIGCNDIGSILRDLHTNFSGHESPDFRIDRAIRDLDSYFESKPDLLQRIDSLEDKYFETSSDVVLWTACQFIRDSPSDFEILFPTMEANFPG
ncbi:MAG: hypothetical protein P1U86_03175 [Verrucomicrobiales bacterium]|nr:hypothetical protein [Verrucomicrobiales bacterium]